jgi:hypothetical protein
MLFLYIFLAIYLIVTLVHSGVDLYEYRKKEQCLWREFIENTKEDSLDFSVLSFSIIIQDNIQDNVVHYC